MKIRDLTTNNIKYIFYLQKIIYTDREPSSFAFSPGFGSCDPVAFLWLRTPALIVLSICRQQDFEYIDVLECIKGRIESIAGKIRAKRSVRNKYGE